jgi:TonB family protein
LPKGNWTIVVRHPGFAPTEVQGLAVDGATEFHPVLYLGKIVEQVQVNGGGMPPPPPPPPAPGSNGSVAQRIRVGGNVQAAKIITRVAPVYPPDCKAEGVSGIVLLRAVIGKDGSVTSLQAKNELVDARLVRSAMEAVQQWRYNTTLLNGNPVEVLTEVEVNFTLLP